MSARGTDASKPAGRQPRRRRWPRVMRWLAALLILGIIVLAYFLQPTQLTALILGRASDALKLELHTTGPGSYALRPEPRLVLPGLSATIPGETTPFFRSARVELALPWSTLRGSGTDISSVVIKSPDLDMPALQRWLATLPPRTTPLKLPTFTRGLQIENGLLRGTNWRIEHLAISLPSLADGKPTTIEANGVLLHEENISKFALKMSSTPAGFETGLRIDGARITFKSDGELPSLTATGSMHASDTFAIDLAGAMQHVPRQWAKNADSSFTRAGDTPFSIDASDGAPIPATNNATPAATGQHGLRLSVSLGDSKRQPALTLNGAASSGEDAIDATLHGQLSRWPDAWPGLPPEMASIAAPIVLDASYQGPVFLGAPIAFAIKRADISLRGRFRIADVGDWIRRKFDTLLPPIEATLSAPQIDVGGMQLHGVQMEIRDDAAPTQPASKPSPVTPKS